MTASGLPASGAAEPSRRAPGWYRPESGHAGSVRYWDGAEWSGRPVAANRWGTAPRDRLGWVGVWLVVVGSALTGLLTVIAVNGIVSSRGADAAPDAPAASLPLTWFVVAGIIIATGTLCGLIATIRADSRNYSSTQARIALKAGGGLLFVTIIFALTGLAVIALGIFLASIIFFLGIVILIVVLAVSF